MSNTDVCTLYNSPLEQINIDDDTRCTLSIIQKHLEMAKAKDVVFLPLNEKAYFADFFVVASGRSDRHTKGIAYRLLKELKSSPLAHQISVEGLERGHWIIIDIDSIIIHIFYEPVRTYYQLEELWG